MIIAVDWNVKRQIKQVSCKFEQLLYGYCVGALFFFLLLRLGLCDKIGIYFRF